LATEVLRAHYSLAVRDLTHLHTFKQTAHSEGKINSEQNVTH